MMALSVLLITLAIISSGWVIESVRNGVLRTTLNHFWFFSFLWIVFFPLRAFLITTDMIDLQVDRAWEEPQLVASVLIALCFWLFTFLGYLSFSYRSNERDVRTSVTSVPKYSSAVVLLLVGLAWMFMFKTVLVGGEFRSFLGNEQNEDRMGSGYFFMWAELYLYAFVAYIAVISIQKPLAVTYPSFKWVVIAIIVTSFVMTIAITSRRVISTVIFVLVVLYLLRRGRGGTLAVLIVAATVFAAPLLDAFRYIDASAFDGDLSSVSDTFFSSFESRRFWTSLSSSFEGVDHLAAFTEKAGIEGLLIGVDGGGAWIYNAFLGLVPRAIWDTKPELYGSVAQQFFLYPEMYADGPATTTFPPSFVVDFIFGLGMFVGLVLAFILGRALKVLSLQLWSPNHDIAVRAVPLFVFINMFNVVRGGTGFLQSLIMFVIVASFVIGFRPMIGELMRLLRLILLPRILKHRK